MVSTAQASAGAMDVTANDLGPLAWVLDELRKSVDNANKALKRYVRDAETARGSDLSAVDASQLRIARQQLHQSVGALEMVGFSVPASMLRGMETAVQKFIAKPELCSEAAATKIERASFALLGYLEALLLGRGSSAVELFSQYTEVLELAGATRIHPADLWSAAWRWRSVADCGAIPKELSSDFRSSFDKTALLVIKNTDLKASAELAQMCAGLASQTQRQVDINFVTFWRVAAGFFDALASSRLNADVYVKRTISRVLLQLATHIKGDASVPDRLAQDLVFFCAQASSDGAPSLLDAVRQAYELQQYKAVDYNKISYGQYDPTQLVQARKRIGQLKESWSAFTAGEISKSKPVQDQMSLLVDSINKLLPTTGQELALAFTEVSEATAKQSKPPEAGLGIEVATSILYVEANFEDFNPDDSVHSSRMKVLAERMRSAIKGLGNQALETWMEELYRRISDRQTMGSVVGELKLSLNELEKMMDSYFRDPQDKLLLKEVPARLSQMRGVLSVLGLDQASQAVSKMRGVVENLVVTELDLEKTRDSGTFEKLGNNLGALGFLIDMLSYQPALAKKLFIYDEAQEELRPVMGRSVAEPVAVQAPELQPETTQISVAPSLPAAHSESLAVTSSPVQKSPAQSAPAIAIVNAAEVDPELLDIFLEEAREVSSNGLSSVVNLRNEPNNIGEMTSLRRAFHTLKGSSRMVGLNVFGEAAWALEQVMNTWLAEQKPANVPLCDLAEQVLTEQQAWIEEIAKGGAQERSAAAFRASGDAMRVEGRFVPLTAANLYVAADAIALTVDPAPAANTIHIDPSPSVATQEAAISVEIAPKLPDIPAHVANSASNGSIEIAIAAAAIVAPSIAVTASQEPSGIESLAANSEDSFFDLDFPAVDTPAVMTSQAASDLPALLAVDLPAVSPTAPQAELVALEDETLVSAEEMAAFERAMQELHEPAQTSAERGLSMDALPEVIASSSTHVTVQAATEVNALDFSDLQFTQVPVGGVDPLIGVVEAKTTNFQSTLTLQVQPEVDFDSRPTVSATLESLTETASNLGIDLDSGHGALSPGSTFNSIGALSGAGLSMATAGIVANSSMAQLTSSRLDAQETSKPKMPLEELAAFQTPTTQLKQSPVSVVAPRNSGFAGIGTQSAEDQIKAIGPLRVSIPLYNVYLNEADVWSRQLSACIGEWQLDRSAVIPKDAIAYAHSLAGSSGTVGFSALSGLARNLEHVLTHLQTIEEDGAYDSHLHSELLGSCAEEIRKLLHQFAAGFLKEPSTAIEVKLAACLQAPFADSEMTMTAQASLNSGYGDQYLAQTIHQTTSATSQAANLEMEVTQAAQAATAFTVEASAERPDVQIDSAFAGLLDDNAVSTDASPGNLLASAQSVKVEDAEISAPEQAFSDSQTAEILALEAALAAQTPDAVLTQDSSTTLSAANSMEVLHAAPIDTLHTVSNAAPLVHTADDASSSIAVASALGTLGAVSFVGANLLPATPHAVEVNVQPILAVQQAQLSQDELLEEIDAQDAIDPDLFEIFEEEAQELFPHAAQALRLWSAQPSNLHPRSELLRDLHTLKGSSRLAGALRLGEMAHRMESQVETIPHEGAQRSEIEALMVSLDGMQVVFDRLCNPLADAQESLDLTRPQSFNEAKNTPKSDTNTEKIHVERAGTAPDLGAIQAMPSTVASPAMRSFSAPLEVAQSKPRMSSAQTVRVRAQLLDRLMNQAGEVMITRSRLEAELSQLRGSLNDLGGNLERLRQQLRELDVQAESQMQTRIAQSKETDESFDPLEFDRYTRVQELTRMMAESVNDVATVQRNIQRTIESTEDDLIAQARQTRELQRDLLRTRMVEFEGISERLYRVVRQASKDAGKQVKLDIIGGTIEMDRGVLDRMTPAFEHLLRNCVAHGIEDADIRTAAGKAATGEIVITLSQEGNDVSLNFRDDGAGLNLTRIREKALAQGLLTADVQLDDSQASQLIFTPGFSTASSVTELSGRGVGMDVVRTEINALGGRIETSTQAGQGTNFKLVLPLTTAVTQVVMIRVGQLSIGIPANLVEIVRRVPAKDVQSAYNTNSFEYAGENIAFFWSGALLQHSSASVEPASKSMPVVVFRSAAQRIALHVDEVLGNQEVVVKNLGPQLSRLPGLAGMSVLPSGAVVLIYNPVALATVYGNQARAMSADKAQPHVLESQAQIQTVQDVEPRDLSGDAAPVVPLVPANPLSISAPAVPLVLVVDDSITVRRVTQRLLQRDGYRVAMAADGLQALERLAEELPNVILSDIEMPRMDGFDLLRNVRSHANYKHLPTIMITSRIAEKHRDHAIELGANHYLGKPYNEEELLSLIRRYAFESETA